MILPSQLIIKQIFVNISIFQAIKHENINRPQSPCEEDPDYNFAYCVEKFIVAKAGCKPHWSRFKMPEVPTCKNISMLKRYGNENERFSWMYRKQIIDATKCLMPCYFMKYKVIIIFIIFLFTMFLSV